MRWQQYCHTHADRYMEVFRFTHFTPCFVSQKEGPCPHLRLKSQTARGGGKGGWRFLGNSNTHFTVFYLTYIILLGLSYLICIVYFVLFCSVSCRKCLPFVSLPLLLWACLGLTLSRQQRPVGWSLGENDLDIVLEVHTTKGLKT